MKEIKAVRKLWFCSGHRVLGHENKCANAHGHNYTLYAYAKKIGPKTVEEFEEEAEAGIEEGRDSIGRVIDFSCIKKLLGDWLDKNWDHTFIIYNKDKELLSCTHILEENKPVFISEFNPTAENMAEFLLKSVCPTLFCDSGVVIEKIKLYETDNCFVEVER